MPAPRLIRPNATYAICRVVEGRQYLLRPDAVLTLFFVWVLASCARAFSIEVHAAVVMSTHYHLVVTVPNENVSELVTSQEDEGRTKVGSMGVVG